MECTKNGVPFGAFSLRSQGRRASRERLFFNSLFETLEKITCTYFGLKAFRGWWILITYLLTTFIAWTIFLVTWGVTMVTVKVFEG